MFWSRKKDNTPSPNWRIVVNGYNEYLIRENIEDCWFHHSGKYSTLAAAEAEIERVKTHRELIKTKIVKEIL
jgi:hypothetical protein